MFALLGLWVLVCIICSVKLDIAASIMQTTAKVILRNVWIFLIPLVGYVLIGGYLALQGMAFFYLLTRGHIERHNKDGYCTSLAQDVDPIA